MSDSINKAGVPTELTGAPKPSGSGVRRVFVACFSAFRAFFVIAVVLVAVIIGAGNVLLPMVADYELEIEEWLSGKLGRPVTAGSVSASWSWQGPRIQLHELRVPPNVSGSDQLEFELAELGLDVYAWARSGPAPWVELTLVGASLDVEQAEDGSFQLLGLGELDQGSTSGNSAGMEFLLSQSSISLRQSTLRLQLVQLSHELVLRNLKVHLVNQGASHKVSLGAMLGTDPDSVISLQMEFGRDQQRRIMVEQAYLDTHNIHLPKEVYQRYPAFKPADYTASVEAWLLSTGTGVRRIQGNMLLSAADSEQMRPSPLLSTRFEWIGLPDQWDMSLPGLTLQGVPAAQEMRIQKNGKLLRVQASEIQLSAVLAATVGQLITAESAGRLTDIHGASASLTDFSAIWQPGQPLFSAELETRFQQLSTPGSEKLPHLTGLSGKLKMNQSVLAVELDSVGARLVYPWVFREQIDFDRIQGEVTVRTEDGHLILDTSSLRINGGDGQLSARLLLDFDLAGGRPFIDLIADVRNVRIDSLRKYWPVNKFKPRLLDWLDNGLVAGVVPSGAVLLNGDLNDWPFRAGKGRFEISAAVEEAILDYHPEWPRLESLNANFGLLNSSIAVTASSAEMLAAGVDEISARIEDLRKPYLQVSATGHGDANDFLQIVKTSPLQASHGPFISGMSLSGPSSVQLNLGLPLVPGLGDRDLSGRVVFDGVDLRDPRWDLVLSNLRGVMNYTDKGFSGRGVGATYEGIGVNLSAAAGDATGNPSVGFEASMSGHMPVQVLLRDYAMLDPLLTRVDGASLWTARMQVPAQARSISSATVFLESDLLGTGFSFPQPLTKAKGQKQRFSLEMPFPYLGEEIHVRYGDILDAAFTSPPSPGPSSRAAIILGGGVAELPPDAGLWVTGKGESIDVLSWLSEVDILFPDEQFSGEMDLHLLEVEAQQMSVFSNIFHRCQLRAISEEDRWTIDVVGDELEGRIRLPLDGQEKGNLIAEFKRLDWRRSEVEDMDFDYDPRDMPAMHVLVEEMTFAGVELGRARMESYPLAGGIRIESLETSNESMEVRASGDWLLDEVQGQRSEFTINITSESLGDMISAFGYAEMVDGAQSLARFDVWWPGAPSSFALGKLGGDLDVSIGSGRLPEVSPGVGRLFGLLSIQALPNRLLLDFTDLFDKGLKFDSISGQFSLQSGEAYTQDLIVRSRSADIIIDGRVGLGDRDYNQVVIVVPKVSQALPVVGAIAAGPAGAAAMIAVQAVFGGKIEEVTQYRYSLTGPWDDPKVELLGASGGTVTRPKQREKDRQGKG